MDLLIYFILSIVISWAFTGIVLKVLIKKAILDHPNERSSHSIATPRGGGWGIMMTLFVFIVFLAFYQFDIFKTFLPAFVPMVVLILISWLDDLKNLGAKVRFIVQFLCVIGSLSMMPYPEAGWLSFSLPPYIEYPLVVLGWVWFINLFNFMDGIDGISGVETISIGTGMLALSLMTGTIAYELQLLSILISGAALGFLKWNWHKAKVFMGDVGSIPIGFLLGWLLLQLAAQGFFIAALLIALYYLMDATITLLRRLARKEKIWQAHREHFYQQATQAGLEHNRVVLKIATLNVVLIVLAQTSISHPLISLLAGLGATAYLLWLFSRKK